MARKLKNFQKNHYGFISNQNRLEKAEKERKYELSFRFVPNPTGNRKFQKNCKIIQKIQKYHYSFISGQNSLKKVEKERK